MPVQLLQTKFYTPPLRPNLVPRPHLIQRLDEGLSLGHRLTLVSAPAGFGKTTLLSEWIYCKDRVTSFRPVAWVSLDKGDNDPVRFWAYFVTALQRIAILSENENENEAGVGEAALAALQSPRSPPIEALLTGLINEIAEISAPFALVLDDYHVITDQQINDDITFLLDHLPPQMHLIISSRADPPWPLARLRVRGEMTELRVKDLRFTPEEAAAFLNNVMELDLSPEDVAALEDRTEGWIAGLQMAAISMQRRKRTPGIGDVSGFVKAFTGSNRFILDYLVEEVLDQQSPAVQEFLLKTSILERMTAPLCDAVTDRDDSHALLGRLEQANLFLVPLDDERCWYRYHHLFADLLRNRLRQTLPDQVPGYHLRASEWYQRNELTVDALSHALAADDAERAARLVEGNALTMLDHGELATLVGWLDALPKEIVRSRPWLCVAYAWVLVHTGHSDAIEPLLQDAENALAGLNLDLDLSKVEGHRIAGHIAAIRAYAAGFRGEKGRATELAREALEHLPEEDLVVRGYTMSLLGAVLRWDGDFATATQVTTEAVAISQTTGNIHIAVDALCDLALSQTFQGQLHKAADTCRDALRLADEYARRDGQRLPITGLAHARLSAVLREWNDLEAAIRHAREGVELCKQWGQVDALTACYVSLARALQASGDADGALSPIQKARRIVTDLPPLFAIYTEAHEARIRLAQGNVAAASRWAAAWENRPSVEEDEPGFQYEFSNLTLARVFIAQGEQRLEGERPEESLDKALRLLKRLLRATEAAGRIGRVIEILVLQALALQAQENLASLAAPASGVSPRGRGSERPYLPTPQGEVDQALTALERALFLAEPEGYVRLFVDEGAPMGALLRRAISRGIAATPGVALDYARGLLAALESEISDEQLALSLSKGRKTKPSPSPLVEESLSERELEVLRLLTTSLSTPEIAEELCIAVSTVRSHVKRIYSKLNVHRRMDAILRAKELGLL